MLVDVEANIFFFAYRPILVDVEANIFFFAYRPMLRLTPSSAVFSLSGLILVVIER